MYHQAIRRKHFRSFQMQHLLTIDDVPLLQTNTDSLIITTTKKKNKKKKKHSLDQLRPDQKCSEFTGRWSQVMESQNKSDSKSDHAFKHTILKCV